jgi:hypothetical protein
MLNSMDRRQCRRTAGISAKLYCKASNGRVTYETENRRMKTVMVYLILHLFSDEFQLLRLRRVELKDYITDELERI